MTKQFANRSSCPFGVSVENSLYVFLFQKDDIFPEGYMKILNHLFKKITPIKYNTYIWKICIVHKSNNNKMNMKYILDCDNNFNV